MCDEPSVFPSLAIYPDYAAMKSHLENVGSGVAGARAATWRGGKRAG